MKQIDKEVIDRVKSQIVEQRSFVGNSNNVLTTHLASDIEALVRFIESNFEVKERLNIMILWQK